MYNYDDATLKTLSLLHTQQKKNITITCIQKKITVFKIHSKLLDAMYIFLKDREQSMGLKLHQGVKVIQIQLHKEILLVS